MDRASVVRPSISMLGMIVSVLLFHRAASSCDLPSLPTDLDLITSVEATNHREVHLHGMYRIGLDSYNAAARGQVHNLTLKYPNDQEIRVSVLPHDSVTMEVSLLQQPGDQMIECSMKGGRGSERMLFAVLQSQVHYVLQFKYSMAWTWGATQCPSIMVELASQPHQLAPTFNEVCFSASTPHIPAIVPDASKDYYFEYITPSDTPDWIPLRSSPSSSSTVMSMADQITAVGSYMVNVPRIPGRQRHWKFSAKLQSRFLDGGDLFLVLTPNEVTTVPTPDLCANGTIACVTGTRALRNHFMIQTILTSSADDDVVQYTLWVLRRGSNPKNFNRRCAPASFHITLFPLHDSENFVSCSVDPLPASFNTPGLYDNLTGTMTYSQAVLVNLTSRFQEVRFQPTVQGTSLMRIYLGAHDELDIDLILLEKVAASSSSSREGGATQGVSEYYTVAASLANVGPEGIIYPVDSDHEYVLRVSIPYPFRSYNGKDHDYYHFCDSYHLAVHVFPQVASSNDVKTDNAQCTYRPANFYQMQETLNATQRFEFGLPSLMMYSFTYPLNTSHQVGQELIQTIRFYAPSSDLMISAITYSDAYAGTVQMQLIDEDDISGGETSPQPLYSTRRTVGSSITANLEEGWYTLKLLTPYAQMTGKTFSDVFGSTTTFPTCIRYNINLRIQKRDSCLSALQLPEEYPTTAHLHRHVADSYEIPIDGKHYMSIQPKNDAMLHVLISASDYPVQVLLLNGDVGSIEGFDDLTKSPNLLTFGRSVFGTAGDTRSELVVKLFGGKAYTLFFDFTASEEWDGAYYCSTFDMQMSVSKIFPLSDSDANDCDRENDMIEDTELGELSLPFSLGPMNVALHPKGSDAGRTTALFHTWSISFSIGQRATLRANLEYEFTHHSFGLLLCRCDPETDDCGSCTESFGYFNGLEVPATVLDPGSYVLYLKPWSYGVFSGNSADDIYINFCTYAMLQLLVYPVEVKQSQPPMCSAMLQYLPATLNNLAFLSPYYNDEMHAFMNVLISNQHVEDMTAFHLSETSVFRAMSPAGGVLLRLSIIGTDNSYKKEVYSRNAALYVELDAGSYEFRVHFFVTREWLSQEACRSIPLEMSIMTKEDITAVSADNALCKGSLPFPSKPFFHGHDTLYRNPSDQFTKRIDFSIGDLGGDVEFDIRYNFETSGLQVRFWGEEITQGGSQPPQEKAFSWVYYPDRAYLLTSLHQGSYHLEVTDPVQRAYADATAASCIPYSVHLRSTDYGNYSSQYTPAPSTPTPSGVMTPKPDIDCRMLHLDPFPTSLFRTRGDREFRYSSRSLRIPFDSASQIMINVGQHQIPLQLAKHTVSFSGSVTQVLRVWVRSMAKVFMQVRLLHVNSDQHGTTAGGRQGSSASDATEDVIATSSSFGYHTQTMYYPLHRLSTNTDDSVDMSTRDIRMEILFYFRQAPVYQTDYTDCSSKQRLNTFEFYAALFPEDSATVGTTCNDTVADMAAEQRLPPQQLTLATQPIHLVKDVTMTQDDVVLNGQQHGHRRHMTRPPTTPVPSEDDYDTRRERAIQARTLRALAVGDVPGVSDELQSSVNIVVNTTLVIPANTAGARITWHIKYPLNYMNLRSALYSTNQSGVLVEGFGTPIPSNDGLYQAEAILRLTDKTLGPGTYTLIVMESNAVPFFQRQQYCLPLQWSLDVTADGYPSTPRPVGAPPTTAAPKVVPRIVDIFPRNEVDLDPSDALEITFVFSEDASMSVSRSQHIAVLQRDDNGVQLLPTSQYFADTTQFVVVFAASSLDWGVTYHMVLDANVIRPAAGGVFDISTFTQSRVTYAIATCGCLGGYCVPGGACQCTERGGDHCTACPAHYQLSARPVQIGYGSQAVNRRVCAEIPTTTTEAPTTTTYQPSRRTPAPHRATPNPTDDGRSYETTTTTAAPDSASSGTGTAAPAQNPPLRLLRHMLAYSVLVLMVGYVVLFAFRFRHRAQRTLLSKNPFRSSELATTGGHQRRGFAINSDDDTDEDDDHHHNMPAIGHAA